MNDIFSLPFIIGFNCCSKVVCIAISFGFFCIENFGKSCFISLLLAGHFCAPPTIFISLSLPPVQILFSLILKIMQRSVVKRRKCTLSQHKEKAIAPITIFIMEAEASRYGTIKRDSS